MSGGDEPQPNWGLDFIDFPTGWWIAKRVEHPNPLCSYAQTSGAFLCDCGAIQDAWPALRAKALFTAGQS